MANSAKAPTGRSTSIKRLTGIAVRAGDAGGTQGPDGLDGGGRDREAFPEFYAEYDARDRASANGSATASSSTARSPIAAQQVSRDIAQSQGRRCQSQGKYPSLAAFLPVVAPASALPGAKIEHYKDEESFLFALADALHEEYQADRRRRPLCADRRRVPALHARAHGAADVERGLPALGAAARRRAQSRARRHSRGALALSHLLGQLERPARFRRAAQGHHRSRAAGARRPLFLRGRQSAPRARMARLGNRQACRPARF